MPNIADFLTLPDRRLAYQRLRGRTNGPGLVFLGGYASDMTGTKASYLAERCAEAGIAYLRFDYRGTGQSPGNFREGTIGGWFEDACAAFDQLTEGPQVVIGSSMGGWLGLMLAHVRPNRLKAFIGIAAAPDFTEELIWAKLSPAQRTELEKNGEMHDPTAPPEVQVPITFKLIKEARQHLLLHQPIDITCPVHLLQGIRDEEVPANYAIRIAERILHNNVRITYIKDGDHRLSKPQDLALLWNIIEQQLS